MENVNSELIIENKVAGSGLITLNLEDYFDKTPRAELDIKPWLFREMILKEKDFREYVKQHNWEQYAGKHVAVYCSTDAIIPTWAYMLIAIQLQPLAKRIVFGTTETLNTLLYEEAINAIDFAQFTDKRMIVKGCSDVPVPVQAYVEVTRRLMPFAKSIMYGEACSNVPLFKKK
jgi:hypothetical protein